MWNKHFKSIAGPSSCWVAIFRNSCSKPRKVEWKLILFQVFVSSSTILEGDQQSWTEIVWTLVLNYALFRYSIPLLPIPTFQCCVAVSVMSKLHYICCLITIRVLRDKVFWHPDPILPHYLLPRPGLDRKIVNFMAPTTDRPDYIFPGLDRNNLESTRNQHVLTRTDPKILRYGKYFELRSKIF